MTFVQTQVTKHIKGDPVFNMTTCSDTIDGLLHFAVTAVAALHIAQGHKAKAARLLGMSRPRLYRRLVQLGLIEPVVPDFRSIDTPEES